MVNLNGEYIGRPDLKTQVQDSRNFKPISLLNRPSNTADMQLNSETRQGSSEDQVYSFNKFSSNFC